MLISLILLLLIIYFISVIVVFISLITGNYNVKYTNYNTNEVCQLTGFKKVISCFLLSCIWIFCIHLER